MLAGPIDRGQLAELAARQATRSGKLAVAELPRLQALLADRDVAESASADLQVELRFAAAEEGLARIRLGIDARLPLVCQRCLGSVAWSARLDVALVVLAEEADAERLEDPFDSIVLEEGVLSVPRIVEDEILAAAPLAPMHAENESCAHPAGVATDQAGPNEETSRPFAGLSDLLSGARQGRND